MANIFDLSFWFDLTPVRMSSPFEIGFFVLFAGMIIAGLVLRIMMKNRTDKFERIIFSRAASIGLTLGILGLVWLFFAFEEIQIFGARFWFLLWIIALAVAKIRLYRYAVITVPQQRMLEQSKAEANKYLPRRAR